MANGGGRNLNFTHPQPLLRSHHVGRHGRGLQDIRLPLGLQLLQNGTYILLDVLPEHALSDLEDEWLIDNLVFLALLGVDSLPQLDLHRLPLQLPALVVVKSRRVLVFDLKTDQFGIEVQVVPHLLVKTRKLQFVEDLVVEDREQGQFAVLQTTLLGHLSDEVLHCGLATQSNPAEQWRQGSISLRPVERDVVVVELDHRLFGQTEGVGEEGLDPHSLIVALPTGRHGLSLPREELDHFLIGILILRPTSTHFRVDAKLLPLAIDLLHESFQQAEEELLRVVLRIALEVGTVLLEDALEGLGIDGSVAVGLGFLVDTGDLLHQQLLVLGVGEVLLLQVVPEEGSTDQALDHCVHVASVPDVVQPRQLVQLPLIQQVFRVKLLEILVVSDGPTPHVALFINVLHSNTLRVLDLDHLAAIHDPVDGEVHLRPVVSKPFLQQLLLLPLADVVQEDEGSDGRTWDEGKVSARTVEHLLTAGRHVLQLLPVLLPRVLVETGVGELTRQGIPADRRPLLALDLAARPWQESTAGLDGDLHDDVIVDLGVDALNSRPAVVDGHHTPPHLLLHADVVLELHHVLHQLIVLAPVLEDEVLDLARLGRPPLETLTAGRVDPDLVLRLPSGGALVTHVVDLCLLLAQVDADLVLLLSVGLPAWGNAYHERNHWYSTRNTFSPLRCASPYRRNTLTNSRYYYGRLQLKRIWQCCRLQPEKIFQNSLGAIRRFREGGGEPSDERAICEGFDG